MNILKRKRLEAWFFITLKDSIHRIKRMRFSGIEKVLKFQKNSFEVNLEGEMFKKRRKTIFFFDVNTKSQIYKEGQVFKENDAQMKDWLYLDEIMLQGFKSLGKKTFSLNWVHLVFVGLSCLLGGWILGSFFQISEMLV